MKKSILLGLLCLSSIAQARIKITHIETFNPHSNSDLESLKLEQAIKSNNFKSINNILNDSSFVNLNGRIIDSGFLNDNLRSLINGRALIGGDSGGTGGGG